MVSAKRSATVTVVAGAQWGDEGKGKLVDILSRGAQICARAQGGNNAGHSIVSNGETLHYHIIPSGLGLANINCVNLIGSGTVVNIRSFFTELQELEEHGVVSKDRIFISDRAHVVLELHQLVDGLEESELGAGMLGTTKKGIGPTYSTKMSRSGIRIADIFNQESFEARVRRLAAAFQKRFGDLLKYDVEKEIIEFRSYRDRLRPFIIDQVPLLQSAKAQGLEILVEGANALMLDVASYCGTYPFVTSSNTGVGGVLTGLTLGWRSLKEVIGVVKAYTTRVGAGPFPTEQLNDTGDKLQSVGHEFGATTKRRRRCGWLDLVVVRYSHACNDYTAINLTKLDILDTFDTIQVGVAYKHNGQTLDSFPADIDVLNNVEVVYETLPGWKAPTTGVRTYADLPELARKYVEYVEEAVGVPVKFIGTGPDPEAMIRK